jgi:hypothetical protein
LAILIISPTPGQTTTEKIFDLILAHPQGITTTQLSRQLNRPVSMVNHCLKLLRSSKQVYAKLSVDGKQWLYFPLSNNLEKMTRKMTGTIGITGRMPVLQGDYRQCISTPS